MKSLLDFISEYTTVSNTEWSDFQKIVHTASYPKNEVLIRQGENVNRISFVTKGSVRSYYLDDKGVDHTVGFVLENQPLMTFDGFFQRMPSAVSAITLEATEILWTSYEEFFGYLRENPRLEPFLRDIISGFILKEAEHTRLLRINSSKARYEAFYELHPDIVHRVPLKHIASYLDMALETLSRVRAGKL